MTSSLILITSQRPYLINITVLDSRVSTHELEGQGTHKSSIGNTHTHTHTHTHILQLFPNSQGFKTSLRLSFRRYCKEVSSQLFF